MTQPVPEDHHEALDLTEAPADQHDDELPDEADKPQGPRSVQEENAGSSADQPSDGAG